MGCVMEDERRGSGGEDWRDSVDSVDPILWAEKKFLVLADGDSVWLVLIDRACGGAADQPDL